MSLGGRRPGHLGVLDVLRPSRLGGFSHVHGAATQQRTTGCQGSNLRKGRPNRHNVSLFVPGADKVPGSDGPTPAYLRPTRTNAE